MLKQVPTIQTADVPQMQYLDQFVDVPVAMQRRVPVSQTVQQPEQMPQIQHIDKIIDASILQIPVVTVEVVNIIPDQVEQRSVEQIVDVPVPTATSQERISEFEQIVDVPVTLSISKQAETKRELAVTQATDEQQANTRKELAHQSQLTLAFTQKDVEYKTNEVSVKSAAVSQSKADLDGAKRSWDLHTSTLTRQIGKIVDAPVVLRRQLPPSTGHSKPLRFHTLSTLTGSSTCRSCGNAKHQSSRQPRRRSKFLRSSLLIEFMTHLSPHNDRFP